MVRATFIMVDRILGQCSRLCLYMNVMKPLGSGEDSTDSFLYL